MSGKIMIMVEVPALLILLLSTLLHDANAPLMAIIFICANLIMSIQLDTKRKILDELEETH